jgi:hypothetical protein
VSVDLTEKQSSSATKIVGADVNGNETSYIKSTPTGDVRTADVCDTSGVYKALSVTTTAAEARVGAAALISRKTLTVCPTNGTVYYGFDVSVTISSGTPIFKNQLAEFSFTENVKVFLITQAGTVDCRIAEAS